MTGMQSLYLQKKLAVIQSVGSTNPNFSHFRATDIWLSGSDANQTVSSGWLGRYLDEEFPDYPNGSPNAVAPDPLATQIGSVVSTGFQGPETQMGIRFFTNGDELEIRVYDTVGREVALVARGSYSPGEHEISFNADNLPSGLYFYRVSIGNAPLTYGIT